ncbi:serine hydrolase domain-containing protein [Streptomyces sp. NPDC048483]|uniref:serine hydrolase domain-containing protein n=1 Tax=Streptomyces sp. NPDC048483 TaxID=3154927 RepID=UPI00341222E9
MLLSLVAAAAPTQAAAANTASTDAVSTPFSPSEVKTQGHERKTRNHQALNHQALDRKMAAIHAAGMYGVYAAVRDGRDEWRGAAGVTDVNSQRPVRPEMRHRMGSITKAFTSVAVLQEVAKGRIELDAPIGRYLPDLIPGERGRKTTVRMLLNHTSGIADYIPGAFPSLLKGSATSLDDNRFRHFDPEELARLGLSAQPTNEPGANWRYSNTNYIIVGMLLQKVTGENAEEYITRNVIRKAGLKHTYFPNSPRIAGPHSKMYESLYGIVDPARDYSTYDMSWGGTAGALVSTMGEVNVFYRALLRGTLLPPAQLREMQTTVPVKDEHGKVQARYGLGIQAVDTSCGRFWGHTGAVWGAESVTYSTPDGRRQMTIGYNRTKYQQLDEHGQIEPGPIDDASRSFSAEAMCGVDVHGTGEKPAMSPAPFAAPYFPSVPESLTQAFIKPSLRH